MLSAKPKHWVIAIFGASAFGCALVALAALTSTPQKVGDKLPHTLMSAVPTARSSTDNRILVIYGAGSSPAAERAFRYIEVRAGSSLPMLPTLLISDSALYRKMGKFHLNCEVFCNVITDRWGLDRLLLRLRSHPYHVYVAERNGDILFSDDIADTSDIQLLTEKFLTGHIDYSHYEHHDAASLLGKQLSEFQAVRVADGAVVSLPAAFGKRHAFLLFTARCPDCSLDGLVRAGSIMRATETAQSNHTSPENNLALLFSSRFNSEQLRQLLISTKASTDVYQANGSIPALENLASLTVSTPADICLIHTDPDFTILGVTSYAFSQGTLNIIKEQSYGNQASL